MKLNMDLSCTYGIAAHKILTSGSNSKVPFEIQNEPAIPLNDTDTPPDQAQPAPPATPQEARMQAIANRPGFTLHLSSKVVRASILPWLSRRLTLKFCESP